MRRHVTTVTRGAAWRPGGGANARARVSASLAFLAIVRSPSFVPVVSGASPVPDAGNAHDMSGTGVTASNWKGFDRHLQSPDGFQPVCGDRGFGGEQTCGRRSLRDTLRRLRIHTASSSVALHPWQSWRMSVRPTRSFPADRGVARKRQAAGVGGRGCRRWWTSRHIGKTPWPGRTSGADAGSDVNEMLGIEPGLRTGCPARRAWPARLRQFRDLSGPTVRERRGTFRRRSTGRASCTCRDRQVPHRNGGPRPRGEH